ncbi:MAG: acylphosphatase [Candidatus Omnitrophica bacterium]|nr:acylphosphatase [Candidatus Omnitrophota bacterium]
MKKCLKAVFSGTVQGVGFRFTAERISRHFEVTGYVRNLPNGKVELLAEGEEIIVQDFLKAVRESSMSSYIRDVEIYWSEPEARFKTFSIAA